MNKFEQSEALGRNKAIKFLKQAFAKHNPKIEEAGQFDPYDIKMTLDNGLIYVIECKNRKFPVTQYPSYILETKKLNALMAIPNCKHIYFNTFIGDSILVFDLDKIDFTKEHLCKQQMPASTDGDNTKIEKGLYFLSWTLAKHFRL